MWSRWTALPPVDKRGNGTGNFQIGQHSHKKKVASDENGQPIS